MRKASEKQLLMIGKLLTLACGVFILAFALWQYDPQGETASEKMGRLGAVLAGPLPCFFLLGMFSRRVNTTGAVIGAVAGITFSVVFNGIPGLVEKRLDWFNWMWIAGLATAVNLIVGYAASYLFRPPSPDRLKGTTVFGDG